MPAPRSCDTFAAMPPGTAEGAVVFGKNSDRPRSEVQEVVYFPAADHPPKSTLKCTYVEVEQALRTHATILSRPAWMWGAEMGANEHGLCIGNEAVWTKVPEDPEPRLLGMDLLRLGLERARTASEAVVTITTLLDKYGMGGNCSDTIPNFSYHNSFLIADPSEVWVLECAGSLWAAEKVTGGVRNISNELSIETKIDLKSDNLETYAVDNGFWAPEKGPLNFRLAFGLDEDAEESFRYKCGKNLLSMYSKNEDFDETHMIKILRDKSSGICMSSGSFVSTGSQVSVLRKPHSGFPSCHWFTGTPDPQRSVFKPFIFVDDLEFPSQIVSVDNQVNKKHKLYQDHQKDKRASIANLRNKINEIETNYIKVAKDIVKNFDSKLSEARKIFKVAVEDELVLYN